MEQVNMFIKPIN